MQLSELVLEQAKNQFYREYRHCVRDRQEFEATFAQLQKPHKSVLLQREIARSGAAVVRQVGYCALRHFWQVTLPRFVSQAFLLPGRTVEVAVRLHETASDVDQQSALLREALVLHLFKHDHILALLHVAW